MNGDFINSNQNLSDVVVIGTDTVAGTILHTLVVPASAVRNKSVIACVAYGKDGNNTSDAVLTKQGSLETILVTGIFAYNRNVLLYCEYCRSAGSSG